MEEIKTTGGTGQDAAQVLFLKAYDEYADAIFRHCLYRVYDRELARELMQETFTRTWEYLTAHEAPEHLRAFLYKVALNLIVDHARKAKTHPAHSLDELQESGFEPAASDQHKNIAAALDADVLVALLEKLETKDRDIIIMRYLDELSPKEIAAALGESENVVSVRLHRAVAKARALI